MINDKLLFIRDGFCLTIPKAEETGSAEEHPASNKIMCCVPLLPLLRSSGEGGHANQGLRPQWSSPWTSPPLAIIRPHLRCSSWLPKRNSVSTLQGIFGEALIRKRRVGHPLGRRHGHTRDSKRRWHGVASRRRR